MENTYRCSCGQELKPFYPDFDDDGTEIHSEFPPINGANDELEIFASRLYAADSLEATDSIFVNQFPTEHDVLTPDGECYSVATHIADRDIRKVLQEESKFEEEEFYVEMGEPFETAK